MVSRTCTWRRRAYLLLLAAVSLWSLAQGVVQEVPLKALVVCSSTADPNYASIVTALRAHEMPFQSFALFPAAASVRGGSPLVLEASGKPLYGCVIRVGTLQYANGTNALTAAEESALSSYEAAHGVRVVVVAAVPAATSGVTAPTLPAGDTTPMFLFFHNNATAASGLMSHTGVAGGASMRKWPTAVSNATLATPYMLFGPSATGGGVASTVAAAEVHVSPTRTHLELYFDVVGDAGLAATLAAGVAMRWAFGPAYAGCRRLRLSLQVQDMFLTEFQYNTTAQGPGSTWYRASGLDVDALAVAQEVVSQTVLPPGSAVRFEFVYAGGGVEANLGVATDASFLEGSLLRNRFFWVSAGFSGMSFEHIDLPTGLPCAADMTCPGAAASCVDVPTSQAAVQCELTANGAFGDTLAGGDPAAKCGSDPAAAGCAAFSPASVVFPARRGLFNAAAMAGAVAVGKTHTLFDAACSVALPTCEGLVVQATPFDAVSQHGMLLLPHVSSDVYYNVATKAQLQSQFRARSAGTPRVNDTFDAIMRSAAEDAATLVLGLRPDVQLLHQMNIARFDPGAAIAATAASAHNSSLAALYLHAIAARLADLTSLPVASHRLDDLATVYKARAQRQGCGYTATALVVDNFAGSGQKQVVGARVRSSEPCVVGITGMRGVPSATVEIEECVVVLCCVVLCCVVLCCVLCFLFCVFVFAPLLHTLSLLTLIVAALPLLLPASPRLFVVAWRGARE